MREVEADGVGSGKVPRGRVSVLCTVRCTGKTGLWKDWGYVSDGRASAGLRYRITMKHVGCQWFHCRGRYTSHG